MPEINYFWDEIEDNVVREYDESNNTLAQYTTEPTLYGSVLSQERSGEKRYFQFDGRGSTTQLTDIQGTVTDNRDYSAFGVSLEYSGTTQSPFWFSARSGFLSLTTLLQYVRNSFYLPALGRWTVYGPSGKDAYKYANNTPESTSPPIERTSSRAPAGAGVDSKTLLVTPIPGQNKLSRLSCPDAKGVTTPAAHWNFRLPGPAPCEGFIVQRVDVWCFPGRCRPCNCGSGDLCTPPSYSYFEAWLVAIGSDRPTFDPGYTDRASVPITSNSCRYYFQRGEVRFYCRRRDAVPPGYPKAETGNIDQDKGWNDPSGTGGVTKKYGDPPCQTTPGSLLSKKGEPNFWGIPAIYDGGVRHFGVHHNCCPCKTEILKLDCRWVYAWAHPS